MLLRSCATAAVVVVALFAAGCGGDVAEKNDYVKTINKAQTDFSREVGSITQVVTGTSSSKSDAAAVGKLDDALDAVVADLKSVTPPDDAKAEHTQLVNAMSAYAAVLTDSLSGLTATDLTLRAKAAAKLATESSKAGTDINQAITAINAKFQGS